MPGVVFDTNVFVSAFITAGGRGEIAWRLAIAGKVHVFTSIPILTELARVLTGKFGWEEGRRDAALRHVAAVASLVRPRRRLSLLSDEPDNRILECALESGAEMIVTGDRHLLTLGGFEGIAIVTLAEFLAQNA